MPRDTQRRVHAKAALLLDAKKTHRQQAGWGKRQQAAAVQRLRRSVGTFTALPREVTPTAGTGCATFFASSRKIVFTPAPQPAIVRADVFTAFDCCPCI